MTYRKPHKRDAYKDALGFVSNLSTDYLNGRRAFGDTKRYVENQYPWTHFELTNADISDVAAKAIRVEGVRRRGDAQMTKLSIDLSASDLGKLTELRDELDKPALVSVLRHLIREAHAEIV